MLRKTTVAMLALGAALTATATLAQTTESHPFWDRMDANHDGFVDRSEAGPRLLDHFDALDADHDGKLSRDEVKAGWQGHHADHMQDRLARADTDKDGRLSWAEADARAKARFDKADSNHDGYVDATEMAARHHHWHDQGR